MLSEYKKRIQAEPWRKWYNLRVWRDTIVPFILQRDPVCKKCERYPSAVVDHIKPHRGIWELFRDTNNLQGLCKHCHDEKTAREDGGFGKSPEAKKPATSTTVGTAALDAALADLDTIANLEV